MDRRVTHADPSAEAVVAAGHVLRLRAGRLRGATDDVEAAFRAATDGAPNGGIGAFETHLRNLSRGTGFIRRAELVARTFSLASPLRQGPSRG